MISAQWPPLAAHEVEMTVGGEILYRMVHPEHIQDGELTRGAFHDNARQVSVYQGSVIIAKSAYYNHMSRPNAECAGAVQVTVRDVRAAKLRAVDDSQSPAAQNWHAYIDMRGIDKQTRNFAQDHLLEIAGQSAVSIV